MIPVKNITDIIKILEGIRGDITVLISDGQIAFEAEDVYVTSRLVEGNFPDYKQIIPKETKTTATLLKQDLLASIKTAGVFSDKFNKITFHVEPSNKKLYFETKNSDVGENTTIANASLEGEDINLNFNNKYIVDSLQPIHTDSIKLLFSGDAKPMIVQGSTDKSFLYLAMPMSG